MAQRFADQTVLITGASRGIGLATARHFSREGARVALVARSAARLSAVAAEIPGAVAVPGDTSDPAECARIVAAAVDALGAPIDILISNAGILRRDFIEDVSVPDFEESYRTNVGGAVWLVQAVLPSMRARGRGAIVLVSSELGLIGAPSYASYCMSKFALVGLGETLAHELAGSGVRAAVICPGNVRTDQFAEELAWGASAGASEEKALAPETVAASIAEAATGGPVVVIADTRALKLGFDAMLTLPRSLRLRIVRDAYKGLLRQRQATAHP